jgi:hypothetical protein
VAVPSGLFSGKGKQLYDYLYSLTRGAVLPKRSVRVTREQLMKGSHIGAKVTLEQNIARLRAVGLLQVKVFGGVAGGNEYTVFLPEEVGTLGTLPSPPSLPNSGENLGTLESLETSPPSNGLSSNFSTTSGESNTSFKTNTENDDDEAFARLRSAFKKHAKREVTPAELSELDELLTTEYQIAAARTTVSSPAAFLAEHLRRRLWKKEKRQIEREGDSTAPQTKVDALKCQDCGGSGYYYPEGFEKGVAKCKHEKLTDMSHM